MKLIKLSETHYIVVDDSEIKEGDFYVSRETNYATEPKERWVLYNLSSTTNGTKPLKVTHSTEPLERDYSQTTYGVQYVEVFDKIKPLLLSEVEEAIKNNPSINNEWSIYFDKNNKINLLL